MSFQLSKRSKNLNSKRHHAQSTHLKASIQKWKAECYRDTQRVTLMSNNNKINNIIFRTVEGIIEEMSPKGRIDFRWKICFWFLKIMNDFFYPPSLCCSFAHVYVNSSLLSYFHYSRYFLLFVIVKLFTTLWDDWIMETKLFFL